MIIVLDENVVEYTDDETMKEYLVNPKFGEILEMNESAKMIISYVKKEYSIDDIILKMKENFVDVTEEQLRMDINEFFDIAFEQHIFLKRD